jgi:hypothetical protein
MGRGPSGSRTRAGGGGHGSRDPEGAIERDSGRDRGARGGALGRDDAARRAEPSREWGERSHRKPAGPAAPAETGSTPTRSLPRNPSPPGEAFARYASRGSLWLPRSSRDSDPEWAIGWGHVRSLRVRLRHGQPRCVESRTLVSPELSSADDAGDFDPRTRAEVTAAPSGVGESG